MSNLPLANPDFETTPTFVAATTANAVWIDGTAAGAATGNGYSWANATKSGSIATRFDTVEFHGGSNSLKLSTTATASYIEVHQARADSTASRLASPWLVTVKPLTNYTISGWMKTNYVSGASSFGAYFLLGGYDSSGVLTQSVTVSSIVTTTTAWTFYTASFTTTSTIVLAQVILRIYGHTGTGTLIMDAWFDDLVLTGPNSNSVLLLGVGS